MSQADVTDEQLRGRDEVKKVLQEFHKANKHPVSAVMEYAAIVRVEVAFKEVPMLYDRDVHSAFGYICSVDDHEYIKGCGSTKKDAKSSAARNALNQISQAMFGKSLQCVQPIQPPTGPKPSVAASSVPSTAVIELLRNYIGKTKHPVSTAMEYGAMTGKSVAFREVPYPNMSTVSIFACECIISNQVYPQGIAGTKKEAKTKSAVSAMNEIAHKILGYQNGTAEPEKPLDQQERQEPPAAPTHTKESPKGVPDNLTHNVIKDISSMKISMGDLHPEKRVADPLIKTSNDHSQTNGHSVTPAPPVNGVTSQATENTAWQVVKHPVSVFQEYCQRNFIPFNFDVTDCPLEQGFRATCYVREQLVAEAFAHSKKEAKKRVAALAIEALIPESEMGSIPPPSSALNSDSFAALSKNPISAFMEHAQSRRLPASIEEIGQYGPPHDPRFYIAAKMGDRVFAHVEAKNKKTGRREAADKALRILVAEGAYEIKTEPSKVDQAAQLGQKATHFDKMATLAHHTYNTLVALMPDSLSGRKVLAAMIMKKSEEDDGIVIALGTGNRCIGGDCLSSNGETVNDSHAEIITRRGFIRYIYQNLLDHEPGSAESLFMKSTGGSKLRLRDGITFHLYISVAPCGDAALMTPREVTHGASEEGDQQHHPVYTSKAQGVLRTKIERGEGAVLIEDGFGGQTWDGILRGERLLTMSCSDKICRWNMLGLQGALLSHFVMPIYLSSLTLGYLYDHGHLSRAVCCRLQHTDTGILQRLPAGYQVTHPWLGRVTICNPPRETEKTKNVSLNWCVGDALPEITDGTQGQCVSGDSFIPENKPSQLSKRNLMTHFKGVCEKYGQHQIYEKKTYFQMKETSTNYQMAKAVLFQTFQNNGFGKWVKKPQEEELFV